VLLVSSLIEVAGLGKHAHSKQKSHAHTTSVVSCQVYVYALLVQHLSSVFFRHMVWYGPTSKTGLV